MVGPKPLYNPRIPSSVQILDNVPTVPLYTFSPGSGIPWFCSLVLATSKGQVTIDETMPAPAPAIECFKFS